MTEPHVGKEVPGVFYDRHVIYGVTFNPNDALQCYKSAGDRLETVVEACRAHFMRLLRPYAKYILITEISEPVETRGDHGRPRIHFHGIMMLTKPIRYLSEGLHRLGNHFSVVTSKYDSDKWHAYCQKQKSLMAPELGNNYYLSDKDSALTAHGPTDHITQSLVVCGSGESSRDAVGCERLPRTTSPAAKATRRVVKRPPDGSPVLVMN